MKVLYIIKSFALKAGLERVMSDKMNWLTEHGYDVTMVTYEQGKNPFAYSLHSNVRVYDLKTSFYKLRSFPLLFRYFKYLRMKKVFGKRLRQIVDNINPDIVVTTSYSIKVVDIIAKVCKHSRLIVESHTTYFSVLKQNDFMTSPIMRVFAKLHDYLRIKYINRYDVIISLTDGDANEWSSHVSIETKVIPNPLTSYPLSLREKSMDSQCRILSVGRLEDVKGFDLMIDAFSMISETCPDWHIDIFGQGSMEKKLRKQIACNGLADRIIIHSPTDKIYDEYFSSDIYVLCSRYEGFGMSLIEAMSCGVSCIAFDCKYGPSEIISNGRTGILVENGNIRELANAIHWLINNPDERRQMGVAAYESAKKYKKDIIMNHWVELFDRLCS